VWLRELRRTGFSCKLIIDPGMLDVGGVVQRFGVPYGVTGRLILLYLQKQALVGRSWEIELGATMYEWMKRLGVGLGGKDYKHVREQMFRISAYSLRFLWGGQDETGQTMSGWKKDSIIEEGILMIGRDGDERQPVLWREHIVLSATFFEALRERPVPIDLNAVRAINYSSRARHLHLAGLPASHVEAPNEGPLAGPPRAVRRAGAPAGSVPRPLRRRAPGLPDREGGSRCVGADAASFAAGGAGAADAAGRRPRATDGGGGTLDVSEVRPARPEAPRRRIIGQASVKTSVQNWR
jgi:hypothetical protein